ncbi:MAG: hypothetical protein JEZ07_00575 [Phycisphaerae bacterium]|nr:hypothetical protein [Phycisphaerae bacterium]
MASRTLTMFIINLLNVIYGFFAMISMVAISYVVSLPLVKLINSEVALPYHPKIALAVNSIAIIIVYLISRKIDTEEATYE